MCDVLLRLRGDNKGKAQARRCLGHLLILFLNISQKTAPRELGYRPCNAPQIKTVLRVIIRPSNTDIGFKTRTLGIFYGIDIAQIRHSRRRHFACQFFQIKRTKFIPFG